jgi:hypothetical protein
MTTHLSKGKEKFINIEEVKRKVRKIRWTTRDVNNKELDEAIHYSGNEVFMEMHNGDLDELLEELDNEQRTN